MKKLFLIFCFLPLLTKGQFVFNNLVPQAYFTVTGHTGTTIIDGKSFTNTNSANQFGSAIVVIGGTGTFIIRNSRFHETAGEAVQFENFNGDVIIEDNLFDNVNNGIYGLNSGRFQIQRNQFVNVNGARNGKGQAVQLNNCDFPGAFIKHNRCEGFQGESYQEDWFSCFASDGASGNPIKIDSNWIRGGGPSATSGGITTGDNGGGWIRIKGNRIHNSGNHMFAIAGGDNIILDGNVGYQELFPWSRTGLYAYGNAATCTNMTVTNNNIFENSAINPPTDHYFLPLAPDGSACDPHTYTNNISTVTVAGLGLPNHMITYLTEDQLWRYVREVAWNYRFDFDPNPLDEFPVHPHRPISAAGPDQSVSSTTVSLTGAGFTSTNGAIHRWVTVSGPNAPTITTPTAQNTTVTGLIDGVYEFRKEVYDDDSAADADWVQITKFDEGGPAVAKFYISTSGNDANSGTIGSPWSTLSKVNATTFSPGDSIFFKRGDTWIGNITASNSGTFISPIVYASYGTGAKPIISGLSTVASWSNLGGNIWESVAAVSAVSSLEMVVINGVNVPMGRSPNSGYYTYQSHSGATTITSTDVNSAVRNWTGAQAVIRKAAFVTERNPITAHSGGTLTYSNGDWNATNGYGFYIQADARTLDAQNEWYYNPVSKKLRIFSVGTPTNVKVSTISDVVFISTKNFITFDNINFQGSNTRTFAILSSANITIKNCNIDYNGKDAVFGNQNLGSPSSTFKLLTSSIGYTNNIAVNLSDEFTGALISNNSITNTGMYDGMGPLQSDYKLSAVIVRGASSIVENNIVDNVGYNGIVFDGNAIIVRNNLVSDFCSQKIDGAGIYSWWGTSGFSTYTGQKVYNNIVINGIGSNAGTTQTGNPIVHGIYLDDGIANVEVYNNTSANNTYSGLYLHNTKSCNVHDNTFYNNSEQQALITSYLSAFPTRTTTLQNNIFFSKSAIQMAIDWETLVNDITSFGSAASINSNYYARPIDDNQTIRTIINDYGTDTRRTLANWKTYSGFDALGNKSPLTITNVNDLRFEYNATNDTVIVPLPFNYIDVRGVTYNGTITLAAYSSAVLIKNGPAAPPPGIGVGGPFRF